jgi:hypothetical protein
MAAEVRALREPDATTVFAAVDAFLCSPRRSNSHTRYGSPGVLDRLLAERGVGRPLAGITGDEIATVLGQLWGSRCR